MKSHINMPTKDSSYKQIIILIESNNIIIDFIHINYYDLIITANKVASFFNLSMVKNYIKNTNSVDSNNIQPACLS